MKEQFRPKQPELASQFLARDYTRPSDVARAIERLIAGLKDDDDEYRMFELMSKILQQTPESLMAVVSGSIDLAQKKLKQDRKSGSSATLLYPVDAAVRVIAERLQLFDTDSLSAKNWNTQKLATVLRQYSAEIVDLAGSNTTSKNLPQRAAHLLWLLDQCPLVEPRQQFSFLEIGASGGLILDALEQPDKFQQWMSKNGYRSDFAQKSDRGQINSTLGLDLVKPELDWLQAMILEDDLREETNEFISEFPRSRVIVESATNLVRSTDVKDFLNENESAMPVIFSCFAFYQLDNETRQKVTAQAQSLLKQQGGGLLIISDIAKYRGLPEKAGGCVSWIEDQDGQQVSPRILLSKSTLTEWEEI